MKAYVVTTGIVFALLVIAHIGRAIVEGPALARQPDFVIMTLLAAGLCAWSWRVLRMLPRR